MSKLDQADSPKKVPLWVREPFTSFFRDMDRAVNFYSLTLSGLRIIAEQSQKLDEAYAGMRQAGEKIRPRVPRKYRHLWEVKENRELDERIRKSSRLAKVEVDEGFPTLHRQVALSSWSSLEWLVSALLANWLANEPKALSIEPVRKVKVSMADYETLTGMEKYYYLLSEIERDNKSGLRQGVDRFESTLQIFGFSGSVPAKLKKVLFEFGHVRNVLVHRNGVADARFVHACPWLTLSAGQAVIVDEARLYQYMNAAMEYVTLICDRARQAI